MPPRLQILPFQLQRVLPRPQLSQASPLSLQISQFQHQSRNAHILASLSDNQGAYNKRIRRGRGPASGKGKTSGRGHKGQKQHGKVPAGFNGGQTPEIIVHGERGFTNIFAIELAPANLDRIQEWIDQGRIDPTKPITVRELYQSRCIHDYKEGVKLLSRGIEPVPSPSDSESQSTPVISPSTLQLIEAQAAAQAAAEAHLPPKTTLKQPIHLVVSRASASAIAAVESAGGTVTTRFYTKASIRRIMKRQTHPFLSTAWSAEAAPSALLAAANIDLATMNEESIMKAKGYQYRLPDPTRRRDIEYYRDPEHRGYLAHLLKPLEGPSLFFRNPVERKSSAGVKKEKVLAENRLW
ncbi:ribosomal protein L18e/L15P [Aspergillus crustosus]